MKVEAVDAKWMPTSTMTMTASPLLLFFIGDSTPPPPTFPATEEDASLRSGAKERSCSCCRWRAWEEEEAAAAAAAAARLRRRRRPLPLMVSSMPFFFLSLAPFVRSLSNPRCADENASTRC